MSERYKVDKFKVFRLLEQKGLKKAELAAELGVEVQTVWARWARGWAKSEWLHLAAVLGVDPEEILEDE